MCCWVSWDGVQSPAWRPGTGPRSAGICASRTPTVEPASQPTTITAGWSWNCPTCAISRLQSVALRMLDLDADPVAVADTLRATLPVDRIPGLRSPAAFDPAETAIRAVLGQQVSVAAACTAAGLAVGGPLPQLCTDRADGFGGLRDARGAGQPRSSSWLPDSPTAQSCWTPVRTGMRPERSLWTSPASDPGPPSTSGCARSAILT